MKPFEIPLDKLKNILGGHAPEKLEFLESCHSAVVICAIPSSLKRDEGHICRAEVS